MKTTKLPIQQTNALSQQSNTAKKIHQYNKVCTKPNNVNYYQHVMLKAIICAVYKCLGHEYRLVPYKSDKQVAKFIYPNKTAVATWRYL